MAHNRYSNGNSSDLFMFAGIANLLACAGCLYYSNIREKAVQAGDKNNKRLKNYTKEHCNFKIFAYFQPLRMCI